MILNESNLLLIISFSTNFIVLYKFNKKFKDAIKYSCNKLLTNHSTVISKKMKLIWADLKFL